MTVDIYTEIHIIFKKEIFLVSGQRKKIHAQKVQIWPFLMIVKKSTQASSVKRQVKLTQWSFPSSKLTLQWSLPPSHYFLMLSRASTDLPPGGQKP